jgi:hypothetical protein
MKLLSLSIILTVTNLALLVFLLLSHSRLADGVAPVVRCRTLQVVDDQGRVRAGISVLPASTFEPTGKAYPETVIFRLIDANGRPEVKIGASEEGAGLGFVGRTDETQVKLEAQGAESSLIFINKDGKQKRVEP